jgi:hypothetical protein
VCADRRLGLQPAAVLRRRRPLGQPPAAHVVKSTKKTVRAPGAPKLVVPSGTPTSGSSGALSPFDLLTPARHTTVILVAAAA